MPRLGLGLGMGLLPSVAAAVAPILDSAGSIDQQPLVGEVPVVTAPVFSGATTTTLQWWNGHPETEEGISIPGATSLAWVPTAAEYGSTLYLVYTATNANGFRVSILAAPAVVGKVHGEDWSGYANGNTWTQLDVLYDRTSTIDMLVGADANGPEAKAASFSITSNAARAVWRTADAAFGVANKLATARTQALFLFKHVGTGSGRYFLGFVNEAVTNTTSMSRVQVSTNVARLQIDTDDVNVATGTVLDTLVSGSYYWLRMEVSGLTVGAKLWAFGTPEPSSFITRANSVALVPPAAAWGTRFSGSLPSEQASILWWSSGHNTDAPFWDTFVPLEVNATVTGATVPAGATNTLVVTATVPPGRSWTGATVTLSKCDFWTPKGFGPLTPSGSSIAIAGLTATITFTLPRSVYASETVIATMANDWISTSDVRTGAQVITASNLSAASDPVNAPGISLGKVAWKFTTPVPVGFYADDTLAWVTAGVEISEEYPARTAIGGKAVNGSSKNPLRTGSAHPYDERQSGVNHVAPLALPYSLAENDTAIKARANPNPTTEGGGTVAHPVYALAYGGLHARAAAPAANSFAPPIVYQTPGLRPAGPVVNIGALSLSSYTTAGMGKAQISESLTRLARFNPAAALFGTAETRRQMTPSGLTSSDGYGLSMVGTFGTAGVLMVGDDAIADRREIARWMIHHGCQTYHAIESSAETGLIADGGQSQGHIVQIGCYLAWSGNTAAMATLSTDVGTNELEQTAYVDLTLYNRMVAAKPATPTYNSVGVYEWFIKGTAAAPVDNVALYYDPTPGASYRGLNRWAEELTTLHALGFVHSAWAPFKNYVIRANLADDPTGNDYPTHKATTFGGLFYDAHWTAINAVAQTVG